MKFELLFIPEAEAELLASVKWYEGKVKGLGANFLLNTEASLESISRNPMAYPIIYKNVRRALIRKFPFGIHYLIEEEKIIILAVFHVKRNPDVIKERLE